MSAVMKGTRIQQMFQQVVTLAFMICRRWRQVPGGETARETPAHNPNYAPFRPTPAASSARDSPASISETLISENSNRFWGVPWDRFCRINGHIRTDFATHSRGRRTDHKPKCTSASNRQTVFGLLSQPEKSLTTQNAKTQNGLWL